MNFDFLLKILNTIFLILIIVILIPILHSNISNTSTYTNIYKSFTSSLDTNNYNLRIDENILSIMRNGNNTIYLRHSDDDKKNREVYLDSLSTINIFETGKFETSTKLTKKGKYQSTVLALFFKDNNISFGEVWSSPIARCSETAYYFSQEVNKPNWLYLNGFSGTRESEIQKLKNLFFKKLTDQNLLIVAHGGFPDYIGIPSNLKKSDFLVYNHKSKSVILHGTMNEIANFYKF